MTDVFTAPAEPSLPLLGGGHSCKRHLVGPSSEDPPWCLPHHPVLVTSWHPVPGSLTDVPCGEGEFWMPSALRPAADMGPGMKPQHVSILQNECPCSREATGKGGRWGTRHKALGDRRTGPAV